MSLYNINQDLRLDGKILYLGNIFNLSLYSLKKADEDMSFLIPWEWQNSIKVSECEGKHQGISMMNQFNDDQLIIINYDEAIYFSKWNRKVTLGIGIFKIL